MNIRRMAPIAAALAIIATTAAVLATPAHRAPHAAAPTVTPAAVQTVVDRDPSIPDAAMALRGKPDTRWEQQPETF